MFTQPRQPSHRPLTDEVGRSVRDRLYGERAEITATPTRGAGLLGRLVGGRYRLLERVGAGGMAIVYRGRDERLKRDVAVKVIAERLARDPLSVRRFRREAELCARLAHPNIVTVLDATAGPRMPPLAEARPGLPRRLHDAVQQALASEPDARQDSVAEFRAQLVEGHSPAPRLQRDTALFPEAARHELPSAA